MTASRAKSRQLPQVAKVSRKASKPLAESSVGVRFALTVSHRTVISVLLITITYLIMRA